MSVPANGLYNVWAGNPRGRARDEKRCWEQVWGSERGSMHYQCGRNWTVRRGAERFCRLGYPK